METSLEKIEQPKEGLRVALVSPGLFYRDMVWRHKEPFWAVLFVPPAKNRMAISLHRESGEDK